MSKNRKKISSELKQIMDANYRDYLKNIQNFVIRQRASRPSEVYLNKRNEIIKLIIEKLNIQEELCLLYELECEEKKRVKTIREKSPQKEK